MKTDFFKPECAPKKMGAIAIIFILAFLCGIGYEINLIVTSLNMAAVVRTSLIVIVLSLLIIVFLAWFAVRNLKKR